MEDLEKLQRERYLILRSLRVAHAFLDQLECDEAPSGQCLPKLVDFLHHFAMEHFFAQEEAVLEAYAHQLALEAERERLRQLRRDHALGRAILDSVRAAMGTRRPEPRRIRVDLGKLITQISQSLVRGQDAVHTFEITVRRGRPVSAGTGDGTQGLPSAYGSTGDGSTDPSPERAAAEARRVAEQGLEEKYRRLLEELEQTHLADVG